MPKRFVRLYPEEKKKFDRYLAQNSLVLARRKGKSNLFRSTGEKSISVLC